MPRLKDSAVLLKAIGDGVNLLTWSKDSFGFADSFDEVVGRYQGLRGGTMVALTDVHSPCLVVKSDVASLQIDAERATPETGGARAQPADNGEIVPIGGTHPIALPPRSTKPKRFHGTAIVDATRVGRDAGKIAEEVIAHLVGLVGATVTVTIEVSAQIPDGFSEQVVRTVTENSKTLKFTSHGFEIE